MIQERNTSCQDYLEIFQNVVDVIGHCGGTLGYDEGIINDLIRRKGLTKVTVAGLTTATDKEIVTSTEESKELYLSYSLL